MSRGPCATDEERAAFLAQACAGDEVLRREVESLLAEESNAAGFMSVPAAAIAASSCGEARRQLSSVNGRRLCDPFAARRWRHGRGLPRPRRDARARSRDQSPAAGVHRRRGAARTLRARSAHARHTESPAHRGHLRLEDADGVPRSGAGAGRRRDARGTDRALSGRRQRLAARGRGCRSRGRSPTLSMPPTRRGSFTAISSPRISRSRRTAW